MAEEQQESYIGSILSNPEKRRKYIIVAGSIVVLAIVLVVALVLVIPKLKPKCNLADQPRKVDPNDVGRFPSQNDQALVRLSAYIHLKMDGEEKYLDLELQRAKYFVSLESERKHLVLDTDCATLDFSTFRDKSKNICGLDFVMIESKTPHARFNRCRIDISDVHFDCNYRWFCPKTRSYFYYHGATETGGHNATSSRPEITLHVNLLEFEIDGDPEQIADGQFSKKAVEC